jgi:hypothetical protein
LNRHAWRFNAIPGDVWDSLEYCNKKFPPSDLEGGKWGSQPQAEETPPQADRFPVLFVRFQRVCVLGKHVHPFTGIGPGILDIAVPHGTILPFQHLVHHTSEQIFTAAAILIAVPEALNEFEAFFGFGGLMKYRA